MGYSRLFSLNLLLFGALAAMAHFHVPKGLSAPLDAGIGKVAHLIWEESTDSNAVEVDGIRFETLLPDRVVFIPTNRSAVKAPVALGIRITNNTRKPVRFSWFKTLSPNLVGRDGRVPREGSGTEILAVPRESDYPLVQPGESKLFFLQGEIYWNRDNKLVLKIKELHWIQRVVRDEGSGIVNKIDVSPSNTVNPYYDNGGFAGENFFVDRPYASDPGNNHFFNAELYLVEQTAPKTVTIYNGISWGWKNTVTPPLPNIPPCGGGSGGSGCFTTALASHYSRSSTVPEPTAALGLLALGTWGAVQGLKIKKSKQQ